MAYFDAEYKTALRDGSTIHTIDMVIDGVRSRSQFRCKGASGSAMFIGKGLIRIRDASSVCKIVSEYANTIKVGQLNQLSINTRDHVVDRSAREISNNYLFDSVHDAARAVGHHIELLEIPFNGKHLKHMKVCERGVGGDVFEMGESLAIGSLSAQVCDELMDATITMFNEATS